jgi:hypothetical protein
MNIWPDKVRSDHSKCSLMKEEPAVKTSMRRFSGICRVAVLVAHAA